MQSDLIPTLAAARKAHQMTQAQLAERAGLSRMTVQRTEGGDLDPRYSTLAEMARVLGMDIIAVPSSLRPSLPLRQLRTIRTISRSDFPYYYN